MKISFNSRVLFLKMLMKYCSLEPDDNDDNDDNDDKDDKDDNDDNCSLRCCLALQEKDCAGLASVAASIRGRAARISSVVTQAGAIFSQKCGRKI